MTQQAQTRRHLQGPMTALTLAAALLVASPVFAAAPPVPPREVPGPGPLFNPDDIQTDPVHMALAVIGASTAPEFGWTVAASVYVGEHPQVRAWKLEGPMTNRYNRIACGVGSVFLNGFADNATGLAALVDLATLKVGDHLNCWALRDTDRFHPLPKVWLEAVTDHKGIAVGGLEAEIYSKVLTRANYTSAAAFKKAARSDITYAHFFNDPDRYRGTVIHIEGKLKRINRFDPPPEAAAEGVSDLYEAWVFSEHLGSNPYCALFTEWPADLPRNLLGKPRIKGEYVVGMDGYFFKNFRYQANDGKNTQRDAPLVMGHQLLYVEHTVPVEPQRSWLGPLATGIIAVFAALVCGVLGITFWLRRSDNRVRRRLLRAHSPEFILPPPDAMPVAPPVAAPVYRANGVDRTPLPSRITFTPGSGDRRGESSPPEGGKRGSGDKPPDEGAGARPRP